MTSFNVDYINTSVYQQQTTSQLQQITHTFQQKTTEENNVRHSTGKENENEDDLHEINVIGLSKKGVVVYIISIIGIIMILLILYICRHFRHITTSPHNRIAHNEEVVEMDAVNDEGIYDLIDENLVDDSIIHQHEILTNPYLEVIGSLNSESDETNDSSEGSDDSYRDGDGRNDSTGYLNAYQPLAENWSDKSHVYDHMGVAMIIDSQNCNTSSVKSVNSLYSKKHSTKVKQQVLIGLQQTKGNYQSQSSCPLYMHRSKYIGYSFVMYRRRSF